MSSLKNLPPHVARELLRHVSPREGGKTSPSSAVVKNLLVNQQQKAQQQDRDSGTTTASNTKFVLLGCVAFTAAAATLPIIATYWVGRLSDREEALTAAQVRRGAFLNSGSRDVGVDPNWNFETGEYKNETGYAVMVEEESSKLRGEFLAMPESKMKKYEQKLEAFAKGRGRNDG